MQSLLNGFVQTTIKTPARLLEFFCAQSSTLIWAIISAMSLCYCVTLATVVFVFFPSEQPSIDHLKQSENFFDRSVLGYLSSFNIGKCISIASRRLHVMHSLVFESKQACLVQDRLGNLVFPSRLLDRRPEITLHRRHPWRCFCCRDCNPSQQQTAPVESI